MISYIRGIVDFIEKDKMIIDNNGIGYGIFMPINNLEQIGQGEEVIIYTYLSVKEDAMQLFGFLTREELDIFKKLIAVSGVGPKGAISIISALPGDSLAMAIIAGDSKAIAKAPGIGNKTAQKIIIELKDKIDINEIVENEFATENMVADSGIKADVIEALVALGYPKTSAVSSVKAIADMGEMDVETALKAALKNMI